MPDRGRALYPVAVASSAQKQPVNQLTSIYSACDSQPSEQSVTASARHSAGGSVFNTGLATRWTSNREVDWFVTNRVLWLSGPWQINLAISDHIPLGIDLLGVESIRKCGRLKPQPQWHKPLFLSKVEWHSLLEQEWVKCSSSHPAHARLAMLLEEQAPDVQREWDEFMTLMSAIFHNATRVAWLCLPHAPVSPTATTDGICIKCLSWTASPEMHTRTCEQTTQQSGGARHSAHVSAICHFHGRTQALYAPDSQVQDLSRYQPQLSTGLATSCHDRDR